MVDGRKGHVDFEETILDGVLIRSDLNVGNGDIGRVGRVLAGLRRGSRGKGIVEYFERREMDQRVGDGDGDKKEDEAKECTSGSGCRVKGGKEGTHTDGDGGGVHDGGGQRRKRKIRAS